MCCVQEDFSRWESQWLESVYLKPFKTQLLTCQSCGSPQLLMKPQVCMHSQNLHSCSSMFRHFHDVMLGNCITYCWVITKRRCTGARVQSLVYRKKSLGNSATPGVLLLHGGPHSAVQDAFSGPLIALVAEGYTIVVPNYRGSTGFGDKHLAALPGQAGTVCSFFCCMSFQNV